MRAAEAAERVAARLVPRFNTTKEFQEFLVNSRVNIPSARSALHPQPGAMPSSRLSLRLGQLPHDALAELAARLCSESPALQATAEECMATHKPLSHELVERVLLSPDLLPSIVGPLDTDDGAAAAVCSQWLAGWNATNEPRRRLKQVPLELPEEIDTSSKMAATPDGRLVVGADARLHILDRSMRVLQTVVERVTDVQLVPNHNRLICTVE